MPHSRLDFTDERIRASSLPAVPSENDTQGQFSHLQKGQHHKVCIFHPQRKYRRRRAGYSNRLRRVTIPSGRAKIVSRGRGGCSQVCFYHNLRKRVRAVPYLPSSSKDVYEPYLLEITDGDANTQRVREEGDKK